jgi:hypothetical protein
MCAVWGASAVGGPTQRRDESLREVIVVAVLVEMLDRPNNAVKLVGGFAGALRLRQGNSSGVHNLPHLGRSPDESRNL